jgi:CheY-like chemotaxis protein
MNLLFVDDEPELLAIFSDLFTANGHQVLTASDGLVALDVLHANPVDVLICDLVMPNLGGLDLHARLQRLDLSPIFVFLTGDDDARRTLLAEGHHVVGKPFCFEDLDRVLAQIAACEVQAA